MVKGWVLGAISTDASLAAVDLLTLGIQRQLARPSPSQSIEPCQTRRLEHMFRIWCTTTGITSMPDRQSDCHMWPEIFVLPHALVILHNAI